MAIRSLLAALAAAALLVAGCSDDDDEERRVDGSGYTYAVPDGWEDASDQAGDIDLDVQRVLVDSAVAGERQDDFTTNVNVVRERGVPAGVTARQYAEVSLENIRDPAAAGFPPAVVDQLEDVDLESLDALPGTALGGREAAAWEYSEGSSSEPETRVRQVAAVRDGAAYIVTLTAVPDAFEDGTAALDEVVESWEWE
jgi:hypothetical protein